MVLEGSTCFAKDGEGACTPDMVGARCVHAGCNGTGIKLHRGENIGYLSGCNSRGMGGGRVRRKVIFSVNFDKFLGTRNDS